MKELKQKGYLTIILAVLVTAILVGGTVFVWQERAKKAEINKATADLQADIEAMQANLAVEEAADEVQDEIIDETADWQVYTNEEYGFSFQYPNSFKQAEDDKQSKLFTSEAGHFWVNLENNSNNFNSQNIKDDYYTHDTYGYQYEDSFVAVAGINTYKQVRYDDGIIEKYYIPTAETIYQFSFELKSVDDRDIISQIIESLQFSN